LSYQVGIKFAARSEDTSDDDVAYETQTRRHCGQSGDERRRLGDPRARLHP